MTLPLILTAVIVPFALGALVGHWCWGQADA